jgi:Flp pilus assembly protein TadD
MAVDDSLDERLKAAEQADDPEVWNQLGCDLADVGRIGDAERCFRRAVELGHHWVAFNLANTLRDLGLFEDAAAAYRMAISAGETDAIVNLGYLMELEGRDFEAELLFHEAIAAGDHGGHIALAQRARRNGDLDAAEYHAHLTLPAESGLLGGILKDQGRDDEAEPLLRAAQYADPDARADLGVVLARTGQADEARLVLQAGVDAGEVESMVPLANLLADGGDAGGAETWYRRAALLGDTFAHHNLGVLLRGLGRLAEARDQFRLGAAAGDEFARKALAELGDDWLSG